MLPAAQPDPQNVVKEYDSFKTNLKNTPCDIVKHISTATDECMKSDNAERAICEYLLESTVVHAKEEWMGNDETKWCSENYFMKPAMDAAKADICSTAKDLYEHVDADSNCPADTTDKWCRFLKETVADPDLFPNLRNADMCQEKDFGFYILENAFTSKKLCSLAELLQNNLKSKDWERRSELGADVANGLDELWTEVGNEDLFGAGFLESDICAAEDSIQSVIDKSDNGCALLPAINEEKKNCESANYKANNPFACNAVEKFTNDTMVKSGEEAFNEVFANETDFLDFNPCKTVEDMGIELKDMFTTPCEILKTIGNRVTKCDTDSDKSVFCFVNRKIVDTLKDIELVDRIRETFDISVTEVDQCKLVDYFMDLSDKMIESPCDAMKLLVSEGQACASSTTPPCKIMSYLVSDMGVGSGSDASKWFVDNIGYEFLAMAPCQEWDKLEEFALKLIANPCDFHQIMMTFMDSASCSGSNKRLLCGALDQLKEPLEYIKDKEIDICGEEQFVYGIVNAAKSAVDSGTCIDFPWVKTIVNANCKSSNNICPNLSIVIESIDECIAGTAEDRGDSCEVYDLVASFLKNITISEGAEICSDIPEVRKIR